MRISLTVKVNVRVIQVATVRQLNHVVKTIALYAKSKFSAPDRDCN